MKNVHKVLKNGWLILAGFTLVAERYEMSAIFVLMAIYNAIEDK